ncbi:MAG: methionyl-tRNA formyltransferase [Angelakisella sp.]
MRIVFLGTPDFAVPCLTRLLEDGHEVVGVFCQPDKPRGRGLQSTFPPVKALAVQHGLPVFQPTKLRDGSALALLNSLAPDLAVVVAYGRILPRELLDCPKLGCINIHGSLLPRYRGAAPIQWTVLNGDPVGGVCSMYLAEGMDTGDLLLTRETPVGENETSGELYERLAPLGAQCLSDTVRLIETGKAVRHPQDNSRATAAPMLEKSMGALDFCADAFQLHNQIRGLNPWPGAYTTVKGKLLKVHDSRVCKHPAAVGLCPVPGTILDAKSCMVACGTGEAALELLTVQPEGKGRMSGGDYLRGARFVAGDVLK